MSSDGVYHHQEIGSQACLVSKQYTVPFRVSKEAIRSSRRRPGNLLRGAPTTAEPIVCNDYVGVRPEVYRYDGHRQRRHRTGIVQVERRRNENGSLETVWNAAPSQTRRLVIAVGTD